MKYQLKCCNCSHRTPGFASWFGQKQSCPICGGKHVEAIYTANYSRLKERLNHPLPEAAETCGNPSGFWHYFDFLPLEHPENRVSFDEGDIPLEKWDFLSRFASEKYGINCTVYAYRNDRNGGTNTLKDVAASLTASVLKECGITQYCVASTGNTAAANAKYLAKAGIRFTNFAPHTISREMADEIRSYGQDILISKGDYAQAKKEAADFSDKHDVLISIGNIDPLRVEAKRTMAFEFIRRLGRMPDVYMQAVGGGTGPIALDKGVRELQEHVQETGLSAAQIKAPRQLLVQQDLCDPMVRAWEKAATDGFPPNFENDYPVIPDPPTSVFILSAGNPGMYPLVARIVKKSGGDFLRIKESELTDFARIVYKEKNILIGPAATICFAGFYQALKENGIKDGETVVINIGESGKRYSGFVGRL
jgi:threonine synthase